MSAIDRLRAEHVCPVDDYGDPLPDCQGCAALAAVDALYQAAKDMEARVVHGPDFDLGEIFNAAGRLAAAVRRVEGE